MVLYNKKSTMEVDIKETSKKQALKRQVGDINKTSMKKTLKSV